MADYQYHEVYGEGLKLTPINKTNARKVKLDLPSGYDKFNFYSRNIGNGYFDIIEGKSGQAVANSIKGLSLAKAKAEENIKKYAKSPEGLNEIVQSGIRRTIKKFKEKKMNVPLDFIKNLESPKPVIKKPAPKPTAKKATPKPAAKKAVVSKAKQTGKSNLKKDRELSAMNPGKRASGPGAKRAFYYEYRRNRTDQPGKKI